MERRRGPRPAAPCAVRPRSNSAPRASLSPKSYVNRPGPERRMAGILGFATAHPGLLLFAVLSIVLVVYLLYAMLNPTRF